MPALLTTDNSYILSIYLQLLIDLSVRQNRHATQNNIKEVYGLDTKFTPKSYITPMKNLEWYFEAEIGNVVYYSSDAQLISSTKGLGF